MFDIIPLQSDGVQFEATFSKPMMSEPTYIAGSSTQSSFIESSSRLAFTEPSHTKIPPHQAPLALDHAPWMDLSTHICFLGTCMEKFVVVNDTQFYSMENRMDQY